MVETRRVRSVALSRVHSTSVQCIIDLVDQSVDVCEGTGSQFAVGHQLQQLARMGYRDFQGWPTGKILGLWNKEES